MWHTFSQQLVREKAMKEKSIIVQEGQEIDTYFGASRVEKVARACQFVQRRSPLTGFIFLKGLVFGFIQHPRASLNQLCQTCYDLGVTISPQGLNQRINEAAVMFLKELLAEALSVCQARRREVASALDQFSAVYLLDSSIISVPEVLQDIFPGSGGNASAAAIKIQLLFDYLSGNLEHLEFIAGREPDQGYQGHLAQIKPGSLLIQDLGFFNLDNLQIVSDAGQSFFLTRWYSQTRLFLPQQPSQALDMLVVLRQQRETVAEYEVLLGARHRLPCRMICVRLPAQVAAQRRRRAKAGAQRRGKPISRHSLDLLDWNIFLSNAPLERLSPRQILVCYNLRWQIELIFKLWKSEAALKHLAGLRRARILCELYAKMIGIVLTHCLVAPLRFLLRDQQFEISLTKARQIFQDRAKPLALAIGTGYQHLQDEIMKLCRRILRFARKTKRKKQLSTYDKLLAVHSLQIHQLYPLA
jgi:hypothetical protein